MPTDGKEYKDDGIAVELTGTLSIKCWMFFIVASSLLLYLLPEM